MKLKPNKPSKTESSPKLQMYMGCLKWTVLILKDRLIHSINLTVELIVEICTALDKIFILKIIFLVIEKLLDMMDTKLPVATNSSTIKFATVKTIIGMLGYKTITLAINS